MVEPIKSIDRNVFMYRCAPCIAQGICLLSSRPKDFGVIPCSGGIDSGPLHVSSDGAEVTVNLYTHPDDVE